MHSKNEVELSFDARSVNEGFARMAVAAFITELNPTMDELSDVKTAVSEAVTNAIIHGYDNPEGRTLHQQKLDFGCRLNKHLPPAPDKNKLADKVFSLAVFLNKTTVVHSIRFCQHDITP